MKAKFWKWVGIIVVCCTAVVVAISTHFKRAKNSYPAAEQIVATEVSALLKMEPRLKNITIDLLPYHYVRSSDPEIFGGILDYRANRDGEAIKIRSAWERSPDGGLRVLAVEELVSDGGRKLLWSESDQKGTTPRARPK